MSNSQWREYWASTTGTVLVVAQSALWPVLGTGDVPWLSLIGIAMLSTGAALFTLSILQLRRSGGLAEGDSRLDTTALVDTGVYAIVRHPQYVAWLLFAVSLALIVQHWVVVTLGAASIVLYCLDFGKVDADEGVGRFGDAYRAYMERVPGWNPIAGLWRLARRGTP